MRTISILNFKGGVGKTSLATNLAYALSASGVHVLLVDCDLQGNSSMLLESVSAPTLTQVIRGQAALPDAIRPAPQGFDIVPSDRDLDTASAYIVATGRKAYYTLRRAIEQLTGYDVVLFDHSPSYSPVTEAALLASNEMLIPCQLAPYSVKGVLVMLDKLQEDLQDHTLHMTGIVPFMLDRRLAMHAAYLEDLRTLFKDLVLPSVRTDSAVAKAQSLHETVFEYDASCKAAVDFAAVAARVAGSVLEVVA